MAATWHQILGCDEPVRGVTGEFDALVREFSTMRSSATLVAEEFSRIERGCASHLFAGEAAEAFRVLIKDVTQSVSCLPGVLGGIERTFDDHAVQLRALHKESREAVARAQTHWRNKQDAESDVHRYTVRRNGLKSQLDYLQRCSDGSPEAEREIAVRRSTLTDTVAKLSRSEGEVRRAKVCLEASRGEWSSLRKREDAIDQATRKRLEGQELWNLGDPSSWQQFLKGAADLVSFLAQTNPLGLLASVLSDEALWFLHEMLGVISMVLGVVSLIVLVVGMFVPGLHVVSLLLLGLSLAVGGMKLVVDSTLYNRGSVNPRTGKKISGGMLIVDGLLLVAGAGILLKLSALGRGAHGATKLIKAKREFWEAGSGARDAIDLNFKVPDMSGLLKRWSAPAQLRQCNAPVAAAAASGTFRIVPAVAA